MKNFDVAKLAKTYGAENLRFFFPARPMHSFGGLSFTSSQDKAVVVEAKAVESFNRVVADGYKMVLRPIDTAYAYCDFYISDFESLAKDMPDRYYVMVGDNNVLVDIHSKSV